MMGEIMESILMKLQNQLSRSNHKQPFDLGIIQSFKMQYRHFFLGYVSKIDACGTASEVVNSILDPKWMLSLVIWRRTQS